jgi:hypothetical protein
MAAPAETMFQALPRLLLALADKIAVLHVAARQLRLDEETRELESMLMLVMTLRWTVTSNEVTRGEFFQIRLEAEDAARRELALKAFIWAELQRRNLEFVVGTGGVMSRPHPPETADSDWEEVYDPSPDSESEVSSVQRCPTPPPAP